ncbi:MAG: response regulator transcription factor [Bacteroidales bacterium]|nr:response regulator transcription factor [Bacteroidales bacterium]MCF8333134.1 response regulator transcription factor [Bacteroidales bacterium]
MSEGKHEPIKVIIVDDHRIVIDGLKSILEEDDNLSISGEAESGEEALRVLRKKQPDVMLVDLHMPGMSGIELTRKINEKYSGINILMLTMNDEGTLINQSIEAGASGYILKNSNTDELIDAIHTVAKGKKYLSSKAQEVVMNSIFKHQDAIREVEPAAASLTQRESEILSLIAKEYSNEQIAEELFISERTVETHRKNIFTKTKTKTVVGLIKYAFQHGLI